jgi:hypothetical protein
MSNLLLNRSKGETIRNRALQIHGSGSHISAHEDSYTIDFMICMIDHSNLWSIRSTNAEEKSLKQISRERDYMLSLHEIENSIVSSQESFKNRSQHTSPPESTPKLPPVIRI